MADRFPSPFEIETPAGAEGWEELYTYSSLFSEERREYEDGDVLVPGRGPLARGDDAVGRRRSWSSPSPRSSQYNTRHYLVPPALGVDFRILNGYVYLSPVPARPRRRSRPGSPHFMERAGYYFGNWDGLYDDVAGQDPRPGPARLETIDVQAAARDGGHGRSSPPAPAWALATILCATYHRLLDLALTLWQYHFEFLNLGYAAYLDFFGFCKQSFPSIPDLAIAKMVAGRRGRPVPARRRAASSWPAGRRHSASPRPSSPGTSEATCPIARELRGRRAWLASWEESAEPWFNFSTGSGFYHSDKIWIENVEIPFGFIADYIVKVQRGRRPRPADGGAARRARPDRRASTASCSTPTRTARPSTASSACRATVFPYVENHNFYVEHWAHSVLWRKMRAARRGPRKAPASRADRRHLHAPRTEVPDALWDYYYVLGASARRRVARATGRRRSRVAAASTTR